MDSREGGTLIRAVADLGHSFGLTVIAAGVETLDQLDHVRTAKCDAAQGFLFARPLPRDAAEQYLHAVPALSAAGTPQSATYARSAGRLVHDGGGSGQRRP